LTTASSFNNKKVVVFSLLGAFPSTSYLLGYEELYKTFKAQGVDTVICVSVNDAFVMLQ
jgi:thioredoxin-dependent peroxiredoxin